MAHEDKAAVNRNVLDRLLGVGRLVDIIDLGLGHLNKLVKGVGGVSTVRQLLLNCV